MYDSTMALSGPQCGFGNDKKLFDQRVWNLEFTIFVDWCRTIPQQRGLGISTVKHIIFVYYK